MVPEFPWESVAVPVAKWMGVSSDQLATTFPYFNSFECTVLVPVVALCWRGEPRLVCGGSLDEFGLFKRVPASVRADAISNWFALRGSWSPGQSVASGLTSTVCSWNLCQASTM